MLIYVERTLNKYCRIYSTFSYCTIFLTNRIFTYRHWVQYDYFSVQLHTKKTESNDISSHTHTLQGRRWRRDRCRWLIDEPPRQSRRGSWQDLRLTRDRNRGDREERNMMPRNSEASPRSCRNTLGLATVSPDGVGQLRSKRKIIDPTIVLKFRLRSNSAA